MAMESTDIVSLNKLAFHVAVGRDQWGREVAQPLTVSLEFYLHPSTLLLAAASDDSRFSIRTWEIVSTVTGIVHSQAPFASGRTLSKALGATAMNSVAGSCQEIHLSIELPKAELCLRAEGGVVWKTTARGSVHNITFCVFGVLLPVTIGMTPEERSVKQNVSFDFQFNEKANLSEDADIPYASIVNNVTTQIEATNFRSLEKLVHECVRFSVQSDDNIQEVTIRAKRTKAHLLAESVSVQLTRDRSAFE
ncbi:hypothetical protein PENSPDRAFT_649874 [Peniophora sp. CONT]|nr:hypothetical protein PENSPDRAFT_649874 [Peniophora sp. CONT]